MKRQTQVLSNNKGFSLIELVAVIVILGVLGIATSKFIVFGTELYIQATDRQHVLSNSRFVVERLTRELRESIPSSVQTNANGDCIRFVPIKGSGAYRTDSSAITPPFAPATGDQIDVVSWNGIYESGDQFFIYATEPNHIYGAGPYFAEIDSVVGVSPDFRMTFRDDESFPSESPNKRYYTGDRVVIYCVFNGVVFRSIRSNIDDTFPAPIFSAIGGVAMTQGVENDLSTEPPFRYEEGALFRNAVVNIYLEFNANQDENMFFNKEVHIPNVP